MIYLYGEDFVNQKVTRLGMSLCLAAVLSIRFCGVQIISDILIVDV